MFNYEKMFEPFTGNGASLEGSITWLKRTTNADQPVIDQAIAETMDLISKGETFSLPCPCGCDMKNIHTPINHFMLARVNEIQKNVSVLQVKVIKERQMKLIESQMKQLSNFDKEYDKMINGSWSDRNLPTFKKWFGGK